MIDPKKPLRITALLLDDMPTTAISGPVEMLTIASVLAGLPEPKINYVSPTGEHVRAKGGLTIACNTQWWAVNETDILLLGACGDPDQGTYRLPEEMKRWLKTQIEQCLFVFSLCTGAFILADLGVLNKRSATTHWAHAELFRDRYPQVRLMPHLNITHEGTYLCTSGVKEYFEATLLLIDALFGAAHREKCEQFLGGNISNITQICLTSFGKYRQHSDSLIHGLQDWMHREDPSKLTVVRCAEKSHLSERQMKRRFKAATGETPMNYIQRIRMALARDKLDTTRLNIDQICQQVGYSDPNHFRFLFKKFHDMTPTQYRKATQVYSECGG
ncbi:GlxA family transcriptional regulator [Photobacterium ganghwense]|uniref:GlxA family transcriptional regulator n=1 Tax=Photobacterium ganghwense TaxID=320778 RepID=UPI0040564FE4